MPVSRADSLQLGVLSKTCDHGYVVNQFKTTYLATGKRKRRELLLRRLEVGQLLDMLGLTHILNAAFIANIEDLEQGNHARAIDKIKLMIGISHENNTSLVDEEKAIIPNYGMINSEAKIQYDEAAANENESIFRNFVSPEELDSEVSVDDLAPTITPQASPTASSSLSGLMQFNY
jgi:hypothetical protein